MAPVESIDSHEWIGKAEAAELLGVSPRQIERLAGRGAIGKRTLPRAKGEATARVVYSRDNLEALKAGTPNRAVVVSPAISNEPAPAETTAPAVTIDRVDTLVALVSRLAAGVPAIPAPRPWLTLSEAVEYSGLPRAFLRREASRGFAGAIRTGSEKRPAWRFNRDALSRA